MPKSKTSTPIPPPEETQPSPMVLYEDDDIEETTTRPPKPIISSEQLDIEAYTSLYSGRTKIMRLMFIAEYCGNEVMELEALRMVYDLVKKGENTVLFKEVVGKIGGRLGDEYGMDQKWVDGVDGMADGRKEKLESQLNSYRTNMIKESIRMGYNDFGDFHYAHGSLGDAFKIYARTRDYCTTSKHHIQMCLNVILVSIEMGQFTHVSSYVSKAEHLPDGLDSTILAKLKCAAGLAYLDAKKYKNAARKFLDIGTGPDIVSTYTEVIAAQDVATYGALCALATFDRTELKNKVIDNIGFHMFLELIPEIREVINDFYASRYASCLEYLQNLKANLLLDIHLHDHVETLYTEIRNRALIQYTYPFVSVDLEMMANAFKTSVAELQKELSILITQDQIQARIDSHSKILYARYANQRNATFQKVLQTGNEFDQDVRSLLLRANILKHESNNKGSRKF